MAVASPSPTKLRPESDPPPPRTSCPRLVQSPAHPACSPLHRYHYHRAPRSHRHLPAGCSVPISEPELPSRHISPLPLLGRFLLRIAAAILPASTTVLPCVGRTRVWLHASRGEHTAEPEPAVVVAAATHFPNVTLSLPLGPFACPSSAALHHRPPPRPV